MATRSTPSLLIILSILALSVVGFAADYKGKVVGVTDGDTITVLRHGTGERIRLNGIDCPEKAQAFGNGAKQATSQLAFGKEVTVQAHGLDKFDRTIADVILPDGVNLNQELVRKGWCWWYRKYAPENMTLEKLEADARAAQAGLWRDPNPIPPWVFRKLRRGSAIDPADLQLFQRGTPGTETGAEASTNEAPRQVSPEATPQRAPRDGPSALTLPIIGNRRSHIYHRPDCPGYSQVSLKNRVPFNSAAEAQAAGYRLAKNCP